MKKIFHSGLAALMMLLVLAGFARAATPRLTFTGISSDNKFGRYVPIVATLTVDGAAQQNFELYYCMGGATPSKADYVPGEEENTGFYRIIASGTTAEIMLTYETVPYFMAIAYPAGSQTSSNLVSLDLTALEVEKPAFNPPLPVIGKEVVDVNTVIRITNHADGAEIFYSTDGVTIPLKSAWEKNDPKVFKYDDATGITITKSMNIRAIAFKEINGQLAGSEMLQKAFDLSKPTVKIALSAVEYTVGGTAPTVNLTIPEGFTLGTQPGNVAVKLFCKANSYTQIITANGTALDMSKAIAASREDEWVIECSLVKGDNTSVAFPGEVDITPEILSLEILKDGERPAVPVFSVPSGKVYKGSKVAITCATPGATIYYTTKDDEINVEYKGEITINQDVFIRAMAEKDGLSSYRDGVATATYTVEDDPLPGLTATVTPASGSQISEGTEIEITPSVPVNKIWFKLYAKAEDVDKDDNFAATATEYSSTVKPVPTEEMPIVRVGLVKDGTWKYFSYGYSILPGVPGPVFTPAGGAVSEGTEVEITLAKEGVEATIYYTINDSVPQVGKPFTQTYTQKIVVNQAMTIKAIAVTDEGESSPMVSASYTIQTTPVVPASVALTFNPAGGSTVDAGTAVSIGAGNSNIDIFYLMFASLEEAEESEWNQDRASLYTDEMRPVLTTDQNTIKATYSLDGEILADTFFYATYTVREVQSVELMFRPASGSIVEDGTEITVSVNSEEEIYYAVYADSMASVAVSAMFIMDAKVVSEDGKPVITKGNTFLKCGVFDKSEGTMKYFFASYKIKGDIEIPDDTVARPTFSLPSGEVEKGTKVALFCATEGAVIYYTLNGDEPMAISTPYSDSIVINASMTIKAIALKAGMVKSKVGEATYTLKPVANESEELAGVSIYPNPSDGEFHVSVPVDAQVEVFTVNGQLVERTALAAGTHTLHVDNSGLYFVRVRANGQEATKKVFVR